MNIMYVTPVQTATDFFIHLELCGNSSLYIYNVATARQIDFTLANSIQLSISWESNTNANGKKKFLFL